MKLRVFAWVVFALCSSGCSRYGLARPDEPPVPAFGWPPSGLGQVCVLRPHSLRGEVTDVVRDDGKLVGATLGPSYFCYFAAPGHHHITVESDEPIHVHGEIDAQLQPGERLFLHQSAANNFERVDDNTAREMLELCSYRVVVRTPAPDRPPGMAPVAAAMAADAPK
jgi:hypothetical protein